VILSGISIEITWKLRENVWVIGYIWVIIMKNKGTAKILGTVIQSLISLGLLKGYTLVTLEAMSYLELTNQTLSAENEEKVKHIQNLEYWVTHYKRSDAKLNTLILDHENSSRKLVTLQREVIEAKKQSESVEERLMEAEELSKQLKEALDKWTS